MKWVILENLSIMGKTTVLLLEIDSPVMKSKAMWDHGRLGIGKGQKRPELGWVEALFCAHVDRQQGMTGCP